MSKITAQPARGFPKASQAEKPSGEKNLQTWPLKGSVLSQRSWPQASSLCHQQEVNMQITFNQQPEAASLITRKVACVYSLASRPLPLRLIPDFKCGRGGQMTVGPKRRRNSSTKYLQWILHTSLCYGAPPKGMEPEPQWTYQWYIYYGSSLNQYWINNPEDAVTHSVSQPLVT